MSNFIVYNQSGNIVVDDTQKHIGQVAEYYIASIPPISGNNRLTVSLMSSGPSWFPGSQTSVLRLNPIEGAIPITLIKPNNGGFGAGRETFNAGAGTLYHLRNDYDVQSGFLDVFNEQGTLIWSAQSASRVPRVTQTHYFTYAQLFAGVEVNIGDDLFMLNNFIGKLDINPGPSGTSARCYGIYWGYSNGILRLQFNHNSKSSQPIGVVTLLKDYGWVLYRYRFAEQV